MGLTDRLRRTLAPSGPNRRLSVPDLPKARLAAGALWALVAIAAAGGVAGLVRPGPNPAADEPMEPSVRPLEALGVSGFGERFVAAYLSAAPGSEEELVAYLGYVPDLPATPVPATEASVRSVAVEPAGDGYWAVTVAAGEPGRERFWQAGVARRHGRLVATAVPTPVAPPLPASRPELAVAASEVPPVDDPLVQTVAGWVAAYACGQGDASRFLAPGVTLDPVMPPLCQEARLERWGQSDPDERGRVTVVTEAVLADRGTERAVSFTVVLAPRGGRWEVAGLLGGPPLTVEEDAGAAEGVVG